MKLKRVLEFLNGSREDVLTLGAESLEELLGFIDSAFAVHEDMRSHSGGGSSFGRGFFMNLSKKQKMNTGSSTEAEVVGVSDYAPNTIWLLNFLEAQGYKMRSSVLFQDNESAIKLLRNGKKSSSRRTRHLDIRLFNIKDKLAEKGITVAYCPTDKMVADFFTKPLQGAQFRRLRRVIMGMDPVSVLDIRSVDVVATEERVGNTRFSDITVDRGEKSNKRLTYAEVVKAKKECA